MTGDTRIKHYNLTPKACSYRGADMGRRNNLPDNRETKVKLYLRHLRFVGGCYDTGGAYWGGPATIWAACGESEDFDEQIYVYVRAENRDEAKENIRDLLPNAEFFR